MILHKSNNYETCFYNKKFTVNTFNNIKFFRATTSQPCSISGVAILDRPHNVSLLYKKSLS